MVTIKDNTGAQFHGFNASFIAISYNISHSIYFKSLCKYSLTSLSDPLHLAELSHVKARRIQHYAVLFTLWSCQPCQKLPGERRGRHNEVRLYSFIFWSLNFVKSWFPVGYWTVIQHKVSNLKILQKFPNHNKQMMTRSIPSLKQSSSTLHNSVFNVMSTILHLCSAASLWYSIMAERWNSQFKAIKFHSQSLQAPNAVQAKDSHHLQPHHSHLHFTKKKKKLYLFQGVLEDGASIHTFQNYPNGKKTFPHHSERTKEY